MINRYLSALVDEMSAEGIADPLAQPFTLAALWDDLAALAGEAPPAPVREYLAGVANDPASSLGERLAAGGNTPLQAGRSGRETSTYALIAWALQDLVRHLHATPIDAPRRGW
jgi:hypothetical protein